MASSNHTISRANYEYGMITIWRVNRRESGTPENFTRTVALLTTKTGRTMLLKTGYNARIAKRSVGFSVRLMTPRGEGVTSRTLNVRPVRRRYRHARRAVITKSSGPKSRESRGVTVVSDASPLDFGFSHV